MTRINRYLKPFSEIDITIILSEHYSNIFYIEGYWSKIKQFYNAFVG